MFREHVSTCIAPGMFRAQPTPTSAFATHRTWPLFELQMTQDATTGRGGNGNDHPSMLLHIRISLLITDGFGEEVLRRDLSASASIPNAFANHRFQKGWRAFEIGTIESASLPC